MKIDSDRIMSISAMIVGIGSLFIIIYQTQLIRESAHASVLPYLMIAMQANSERVFFQVTNNGIGPALVENVQVVNEDRTFEGDAFDFFTSREHAGIDGPMDVDKIMPGRLIPAGSTVFMLGRGNPVDNIILKEMLETFEVAEVPRNWYTGLGLEPAPEKAHRAVLQIEYASVYGDRWRVRSDSLVPEPL